MRNHPVLYAVWHIFLTYITIYYILDECLPDPYAYAFRKWKWGVEIADATDYHGATHNWMLAFDHPIHYQPHRVFHVNKTTNFVVVSVQSVSEMLFENPDIEENSGRSISQSTILTLRPIDWVKDLTLKDGRDPYEHLSGRGRWGIAICGLKNLDEWGCFRKSRAYEVLPTSGSVRGDICIAVEASDVDDTIAKYVRGLNFCDVCAIKGTRREPFEVSDAEK